MCGIYARYGTPTADINRRDVLHALHTMTHRGPDESGVWQASDAPVALGHRRLSIVDRKGGTQPIVSPDRRFIASVNGELYEYDRLRRAAEAFGYTFATHSDSEIAIAYYTRYGTSFVHHLRGEFAIVIYDALECRLIAARDRFGIKPLHYSLDDTMGLIIASEAKAILATGVPTIWDTYALYHACTVQYLPPDRTFFAGVRQLEPGQLLTYDGTTLDISTYWDVDYPNITDTTVLQLNHKTLVDELDRRLREAVRLRLPETDIPYSCHVSGGVDSSLIAALISAESAQPITGYTVTFPDDRYDETALAREIIDHLGGNHRTVRVGASDIVRALERSVYQSEGLAINSHLAAKYLLNEAIRTDGFKVTFTGEGADETFLGYAHLLADWSNDDTPQITNETIAGVHLPAGHYFDLSIMRERLGHVPTFLKAKASIGYKIHDLLTPEFRAQYSPDHIFTDILNRADENDQINGRHPVHQSIYLWIKYSLANYILKTLGDGCEMAHSIEGRVPYLDHVLFEWVRTLPLDCFFDDTNQKALLREVASRYLPQSVAYRTKQPFMAPPLSLLSDDTGRRYLRSCFESTNFRDLGVFDQSAALALLDRVPRMDTRTQVAIEPVIMTMLTTYLLHRSYHMTFPS